MSNQEHKDPYLYPDSNVLINKFDIKDPAGLSEVEGFLYAAQAKKALPEGDFDYPHLKAIHKHYFGEIYAWAGEERTIDIAKSNSYFAHKAYINNELTKLFTKLKAENYLQNLSPEHFAERLSFYFNEINAAHPFREGNGRTQRAFCELLANKAGYALDWRKGGEVAYHEASIKGFLHGDYDAMKQVLLQSITPKLRTFEIDSLNFSPETIQKICTYVEKQNENTNLARQRLTVLNHPELNKTYSDQIQLLKAELQGLAKNVLELSEVQEVLKSPKFISPQSQGGFSEILNRLKNGDVKKADIICVGRDAMVTLSDKRQSMQMSQAYDGRSR